MHFDTSTYLRACKQRHPAFFADVPFYPEVSHNAPVRYPSHSIFHWPAQVDVMPSLWHILRIHWYAVACAGVHRL